VVVSTDDPEIAEVAKRHGCEVPFMRPAELATDTAKIEDAILHALDNLDEVFEYVVLLQATSPLRAPADIDGTIARCIDSGASACVAVAEPAKSPYWMFRLDGAGRLRPLLEMPKGRRQDLPPAYCPTGAVYVAKVDWFRNHRSFYSEETVAWITPSERAIDVDGALDLRLADSLLTAKT
jgi:N-acylneuraminate cytidylyltransferase